MTTTKTFKRGDKVDWNVSEECGFVCSGCGASLHVETAATEPHGMVVYTTKERRVRHSIVGGGCGAITNNPFHVVAVAFPMESPNPDAAGGFFTPAELEHLE